MPPGTRRQASETHCADAYTGQAGDGVTDGSEHPAHLPITAFVNRQFEFGDTRAAGILFTPNQADILGRTRHAVFEHDAFTNSLQVGGIRNALHRDTVSLWNMVARMREFEQKIAVISEKDQPFAVGIKPPNRAQHRLPADVYQFRHQPPGMRIGTRRDNPARLIQSNIISLRRCLNAAAIEHDLIGF